MSIKEIKLGQEARERLLRGVEAGEAVVTQAQFMLDSESSVQEAIAKFMRRRTVHAEPAR